MSSRLQLIFVLILCVVKNCHCITYRCNTTSTKTYRCNWTVDGYTLDLTVFQRMGMNLTGQDSEYNYAFSPCNNLQHRSDSPQYYQYMAIQWNDTHRNYLSKVDGSIQPTVSFNKDSKIVWQFEYNTNFYVQYICVDNGTLNSYMEITDILEILPNRYMIQISSYYVCDKVIIPLNLFIDECIWYNEETSKILDLTPLYGESIFYRGQSDNTYYTVCQNAEYSTEGFNKICGMHRGHDPIKRISVPWDPSVQPMFNSTTYSWIFLYDEIKIEWVCNPQVLTWRVVTDFKFESQYACDEKECLFYDPDNNENKLDLTAIKGEMIIYTNQDLIYSFQYTPCANKIVCDNNNIHDKEVMAMRWDINERECNPYLAIWDNFNGYNLSYDAQANEWKFTYDNGQKCAHIFQKNVQLNIVWKCAQDNTDWNVTDVKSINECNYEMYIVSKYVC